MKARLKFRFTRRFRFLTWWFRLSRYKVFEYDLDDFDDSLAFRRHTKADALCEALYDLDQWLRDHIKYAYSDGLSKHHTLKFRARVDALQEARDKLSLFLDDHSVYLDELLR